MVTSVPIFSAEDVVSIAKVATEDAKVDTNKTLWFIAGFLGGIIGVILAYAIPPNVPQLRLVGKSPEYVAAYTDAYRSAGIKEQASAAWLGCGTCAVLYIVYAVLQTVLLSERVPASY